MILTLCSVLIDVIVDDFTETDIWEPFYGNYPSHEDSLRPPYPPTCGHAISCFTELCKIWVILNAIMMEIYGTQSHSSPSQTAGGHTSSIFVKICGDLQDWWTALPDHLRLVPTNLPEIGPPLHIISLNLLYQTTLILVHRPFILGAKDFTTSAVQRSFGICITATSAIHDLLQLLVSTFGFSHVPYLNCYAAYIAATISVFRFQL